MALLLVPSLWLAQLLWTLSLAASIPLREMPAASLIVGPGRGPLCLHPSVPRLLGNLFLSHLGPQGLLNCLKKGQSRASTDRYISVYL